jgi:hypothetical protein
MPVMIHGKEYKTVAERVGEAHESTDLLEVITEVLFLEPQIMVKATIKTKIGTFTGISAADPSKSIESKTPVEVAETSAVGRALAFAGYAGSEIASADEMNKAGVASDPIMQATNGMQSKCTKCGTLCVERSGISKKTNKPYTMLICPNATRETQDQHDKPIFL